MISIRGKSWNIEQSNNETQRAALRRSSLLRVDKQHVAKSLQIPHFIINSFFSLSPPFNTLSIGPRRVLPRNSTRTSSPHQPAFPCFPPPASINMAGIAHPTRAPKQQTYTFFTIVCWTSWPPYSCSAPYAPFPSLTHTCK